MLETEPQIIEQYVRPGRVKIVYRHLQQLGERSELLSEASECAADQGRFWAMRRAIYARYDQLFFDLEGELAGAAEEAGVAQAPLEACLAEGTHAAAVRADFARATAEGIRSRPVFRVGEQTLVGAQPLAAFQRLLDQATGTP